MELHTFQIYKSQWCHWFKVCVSVINFTYSLLWDTQYVSVWDESKLLVYKGLIYISGHLKCMFYWYCFLQYILLQWINVKYSQGENPTTHNFSYKGSLVVLSIRLWDSRHKSLFLCLSVKRNNRNFSVTSQHLRVFVGAMWSYVFTRVADKTRISKTEKYYRTTELQ